MQLDKLRFERILANLLDNANQHGGGPTRVVIEPRGRHGLVLAVEDNGPGVPEDVRPRMFDPFFTTKPVGAGTGLGLSSVHGAVNQMGGDVHLSDGAAGGLLDLALPALALGTGERACLITEEFALDQRLGQGGQDGVAVALLLDVQGGVEVRTHAQKLGQAVRLVDAAGARAADIEFLQGDDIAARIGDDPGHAFEVELAVHPDTAVDVVGHHAKRHRLERSPID